MAADTLSPLSLRLPYEMKRSLDLLASLTGVSVSDLIRDMLAEGIARRTDPDQIDELVEAYRKNLLKASQQLRSGSD